MSYIMEDKEEGNGAAGWKPEFGAIFMANTVTKKECFKRKVFALPSSYAKFVKQVRDGMLLFLFEVERRELFGVYQAISDGGMNILPQGSNTSLTGFPSQVRFTLIWFCNPLSEPEFRGVIRDNYFSKNKFNFGLSEDQVYQLMQLFSSKKLKHKLLPEQISVVGKHVNDLRFALNERIELENLEGGNGSPDLLVGHQRRCLDQFEEVDDDLHFMVDVAGNEDKVNASGQGFLTNHLRASLCKKRRMDNDGRSFIKKMKDEEFYDQNINGQNLWRAYHGNPLNKGWEVTEYDQFPVDKKLQNEDKDSDVAFVKYPGDLYDLRTADFGRYTSGTRVEADNGHYGFSSAISSKQLQNEVTNSTSRLAADSNRLLMNVVVKNDSKSYDPLQFDVSGVHNGAVLAKYRNRMKESKESPHEMDKGMTSVIVPDFSGSPLHSVRGRMVDGTLYKWERLESEHEFGTSRGAAYTFEKFMNTHERGRRVSEDGLFPIRERPMNANHAGEPIRLTSPYGNSGQSFFTSKRSDYDGQFTKGDALEDELCRKTFVNPAGPATSSLYGASYPPKQDSLVHFEGPFADMHPPHSSKTHNFSTSHQRYHDATVTSAVPCDTGINTTHRGHSPSFGIDCSSSLLQDILPYHNSVENHSSKYRSLLYHGEEKRLSRGIGSDNENEDSLPPSSNNHDYFLGCSRGLFLNAEPTMNREVNTSVAADDGKGLWFPKSSLDHAPFSEVVLCREEERRNPSLGLTSNKDLSINLDSRYPPMSQGLCDHIPYCNRNQISAFQCQDGDCSLRDLCHAEKDLKNHDHGYHKSTNADIFVQGNDYERRPHGVSSGSKSSRRSVFTRLTSGSKKSIIADDHQRINADTSAEEVMDMLRHSQNLSMKKHEKCGQLAKRRENDELTRGKKCSSLEKHVEHENSIVSSAKFKKDANQTVEGHADQPLNETRIVDFKRRSEAKKDLDDRVKRSVQTIEDRTAAVQDTTDKPCKRRKLVRPVFAKNDAIDEGKKDKL